MRAMRWIAATLMLIATPAGAQVVLPAPAPGSVVYAPSAAAWNPAGDYIGMGQDEPGYRGWYGASARHASAVKAFNDYLVQWGVSGVLPTWQLLRTATSWQRCSSAPFEVPPTKEWPHIVQTLRYIKDYVVPTVGPVEAVSGYRNPTLNVCAGGAPESAHKHYSAIDMVPLRFTTRDELMRKLCAVHAQRGTDYSVGLGFYAFLRFHVDTTKYRRWGADPDVSSCPPIVRPADLASVAQPQQASSAAPDAVAAPSVVSPKVVYAPPMSEPTSSARPQ